MSRRVFVIAVAAAALLLGLWFLLLWGPQGGRLEDARDREAAAEAQNQALELRLGRLRAAQEQAPQLVASLDRLRRAVPDDPRLAEFILDANDAASETGVEFLSISPGAPSAADGALPPVITLDISVSGEYFSVLGYLDRLEDLPRLVVVDAITLTPGEGAPAGGPELSVSISGRMFATAGPQITSAATTTEPGATTTSTVAPTTGTSGG